MFGDFYKQFCMVGLAVSQSLLPFQGKAKVALFGAYGPGTESSTLKPVQTVWNPP